MIKKNIPNAITCGNLLCGCLAIVCAFNGDLIWSAYLVGIAAVLDFLDGFIARLLKVHSEIGKQLDSLADMVTFGVVPGMIMYHLLSWALLPTTYMYSSPTSNQIMIWEYVPYFAFLITIFSCVRLAKFNIDTRQSDSFIGVPTPANSILIASFPLILQKDFFMLGASDAEWAPSTSYIVIMNLWFLLGITALMSYLLIAELPLFALKFKHFKWKGNEIRFIFLGLSAALLILFQFTGIPFIIFLYVLLSVINNIGKKKEEKDYDLIA